MAQNVPAHELVLKVTGADPGFVRFSDSEVLTTPSKRPDNAKAIRDLDNRSEYSLEEDMREPAEWMRTVYRAS
jgi:nucleoside-diphosphate-sugar epimerase